MSMEKIFLIVLVVLVMVLGPFTYLMFELLDYSRKRMPEGYQFPPPEDYIIMVISAIVVLVLEPLCAKGLYPHFYAVCKEKVDEEQRIARSKRGVVTIFKLVYFIYAASFGYLMMKDTYFLPPMLGGSGSFLNHFKDWPFIEYPPYYKMFFLTCAGYHLAGLIDLFREENRK